MPEPWPTPPRVRVHASKAEFTALVAKLDASSRLLLIPARERDIAFLVGLHSVYNDELKDRLIVDARPPNSVEIPFNSYTRLLGSARCFCELFLAEDEVLAVYADDINDNYYQYVVSRE